jgi:predicted dehydrogenase
MSGVSRRDFMRGALAVGATMGGLTLLGARTGYGQQNPLTAGLVGCGGRGNGAARDFLEAGRHLKVEVQITTLADVDADKLGTASETLKVAKDRCFGGFDGYKKVIESDVDVVILATPPVFRPLHFDAAVKAGKHLFMEKPVAVDPVGCRQMIAIGEEAKKKNLAVVAGTQRRHQKDYLASYELIKKGAIGEILGGAVWWCGEHLWFRKREAGWSNRDYLVRNWPNFVEMGGDHIVEQHVHNIDIANWYLGSPPRLAIGFGARTRRLTGNQYDFFSVDFEYEGRIHVHSMCRQVDGCWQRVGEHLVAAKGFAGGGKVYDKAYKRLELPQVEGHDNPYVQEHVALLQGLLEKDKPRVNEAREVAEATLSGIMGRLAAYTGQAVRWSDVADEKGRFGTLALTPTAADFEKPGDLELPKEEAPLPGKPHTV